MENQDYEKLYKKMQDDIAALKNEVHTISGDIGGVKDGQANVEVNINAMSGNLESISRSIAELSARLTSVAEEQQKSAVENFLYKKGSLISALFGKPLRKLAVGSLSALMYIGGYTAEKLAGAREGLEDIIAEASYNNKMKKHNRESESQ